MVQIGEEKESLKRPRWCGFSVSRPTFGIWLSWILSPACLPVSPLWQILLLTHYISILLKAQVAVAQFLQEFLINNLTED